MAAAPQGDSSSITVDVSQKKVSFSGRDALTAFLMMLIVASWAYIAHFRMDTVDKSHASLATAMAESTKELLRVEAERSRQIEELLRINQRNTASLEVIAARLGSYLTPYHENRGQRVFPVPQDTHP